MNEANIFDPTEPMERRKEKVTLSNGKHLWVWEMMTAEMLSVSERSRIRGGPEAGQPSEADSVLWQIVSSCYNSDGGQAQPIFTPENILQVYRLRRADSMTIMAAIARVNGTDPETTVNLEDFTPLREAAKSGT